MDEITRKRIQAMLKRNMSIEQIAEIITGNYGEMRRDYHRDFNQFVQKIVDDINHGKLIA